MILLSVKQFYVIKDPVFIGKICYKVKGEEILTALIYNNGFIFYNH